MPFAHSNSTQITHRQNCRISYSGYFTLNRLTIAAERCGIPVQSEERIHTKQTKNYECRNRCIDALSYTYNVLVNFVLRNVVHTNRETGAKKNRRKNQKFYLRIILLWRMADQRGHDDANKAARHGTARNEPNA